MRNNGANTRHAIFVNYGTAALIGFVAFNSSLGSDFESWHLLAAFMGVFFYVVFRLIARTAQVNGVSAASIATKMSMVLPICLGIFWLDESLSVLKIAGILIGIVSVVLAAKGSVDLRGIIWLILAFFTSGIIDSSLKLIQQFLVSVDQFPGLITIIFAFAFLTGIIHHFFTSDRNVSRISLASGVGLGIVNFASLFFILKALAVPNWESSLVFPINNVGIVLVSTVSSIFLFREFPTTRGWVALISACLAITLLAIDF
jgi:drug/metabolite transporter (DMT)-like permease